MILQRSKKNDVLPEYWDVPGGTLEDGEDPEVGAIREVVVDYLPECLRAYKELNKDPINRGSRTEGCAGVI